jgi:hypothetical protein
METSPDADRRRSWPVMVVLLGLTVLLIVGYLRWSVDGGLETDPDGSRLETVTPRLPVEERIVASRSVVKPAPTFTPKEEVSALFADEQAEDVEVREGPGLLTLILCSGNGEVIDGKVTVLFAGLPPLLEEDGTVSNRRRASKIQSRKRFLDPLLRRDDYTKRNLHHPLMEVSEEREFRQLKDGTTEQFVIPHAGDYVLFVSCPESGVEGNGTLTFEAGEEKEHVVVLVPPPRLSIRVTKGFGPPLPRARVRLYIQRTAQVGELRTTIKGGGMVSSKRGSSDIRVAKVLQGRTDADGRFDPECPWTNKVMIHVEHPDHGRAISFRDLGSNFASAEVVIRLGDPAQMRRIKVEHADGRPVQDRQFTIVESADGHSSSAGTFEADRYGMLLGLPQLDDHTWWLWDLKTHKNHRIPDGHSVTVRIDS